MKSKKQLDYDYDKAVYSEANIQQYKTDIGFRTLVEGVNENLYIIPNFQRVYKWSETQVENLAISLIKGMPIPPIYTYRNKENQLEILDGQQRVLSMFFYYIGKYTKKSRDNYINLKNLNNDNRLFEEKLNDYYELKDKKFMMTYYYYDGEVEKEQETEITYSKLPPSVKRRLDYTTITVIEISIDDERVKEKYLQRIFANLNSGGTELTPQELRNGIYSSAFYDMLFSFNEKNKKWLKLIGNSDNHSRNIEFLLRLCTFKYYIQFKNDKFVLDSYHNIDKFLSDFSTEAMHFDDYLIEEYYDSLSRFFDCFSGRVSKKLVQVTLFECLFTVLEKASIDLTVDATLIESILNRKDYQDTIKQGNASRSAIESKLKVVYDELQKYDIENDRAYSREESY